MQPNNNQSNQTNNQGQTRQNAEAQDQNYGSGIAKAVPYKNGPALVAYYTSLFSFFPFIGIVLAIIAIISGKKGLELCKSNPQVRGKGHAMFGLITGIVFLIIHILFIVLFFIVPLFSNNR